MHPTVKLPTVAWSPTSSLSLSLSTVRGSPQLPAAAPDHLVREPLRPAGADHSHQVSGCAGRGLGPSVPRHRLLDGPLQPGTAFSHPLPLWLVCRVLWRRKRKKLPTYGSSSRFYPECSLTQGHECCFLMTGSIRIRDEKGFGAGGKGRICRRAILRLLR